MYLVQPSDRCICCSKREKQVIINNDELTVYVSNAAPDKGMLLLRNNILMWAAIGLGVQDGQ